MKNLIYSIIATFLLFTIACRPDKCCVPPEPSSKMTSEKNGVEWYTFDVIGKLSQTNSLTIYAISGEVIPSGFDKADSLHFSIAYTSKGSYNLHSDQVSYAVFSKTDTSSYSLDTTYNNVLNITGYETLHNATTTNPDPIKITGTFDIKLVDPKNPTGISFQNGDFYTIITR